MPYKKQQEMSDEKTRWMPGRERPILELSKDAIEFIEDGNMITDIDAGMRQVYFYGSILERIPDTDKFIVHHNRGKLSKFGKKFADAMALSMAVNYGCRELSEAAGEIYEQLKVESNGN